MILAVVPANINISIREFLEKAEDVNGVLIKLNLVNPGAEKHVVDLPKGRTNQLKLRGTYFVVLVKQNSRNPLLNVKPWEEASLTGGTLELIK